MSGSVMAAEITSMYQDGGPSCTRRRRQILWEGGNKFVSGRAENIKVSTIHDHFRVTSYIVAVQHVRYTYMEMLCEPPGSVRVNLNLI